MKEIEKNIFISGVLKDMKDIEKYSENSEQYNILKNKIINVDEYKI